MSCICNRVCRVKVVYMLALEWSSFSLTPRRAHAAVIFDIPIEVNTSDLKKAECGG